MHPFCPFNNEIQQLSSVNSCLQGPKRIPKEICAFELAEVNREGQAWVMFNFQAKTYHSLASQF